jgi:DNA-binding NtrC family response regulator
MQPPLIFVVDDERDARFAVGRVLQGVPYRIREAESGERCLELLAAERPSLILLDVRMPGGMGGLRCLEEVTRNPDHPPVIMLTAHGDERLAVECLKKGAYHYLPRPYELEELKTVVARAIERVGLEQENRKLKAVLASREEPVSLGVSAAMAAVTRLVERLAPTDVTALISGESGTGKEVVARELHRLSPRRNGSFVALNCAALPEDLVESELFGHEKGSFTGALELRKGKFEQADGGTLFLDEVGEMAPRTQSKLLRVLQERAFERIGGSRTITVDVRLIAASNKDLRAEVARGSFREDLYYRLKVAEVHLPPLRERPGDIAPLALRFLGEVAARLGRDIPGFTPAATEVLLAAPWPGNVRELKNAIEYAAVMCDSGPISAEHLPADLGTARSRVPSPLPEVNGPGDGDLALPYSEARRKAIADFEKRYIERRLRQAGGNVSEAAREMGIARQSLQAKLKELAIDPALYRLREAGEPV